MSLYKFKSVSRSICLNNRIRKSYFNPNNIPYVWYLTDKDKTKDLSKTVQSLSKNNAIIIRNYTKKNKYKNIKKTIRYAKRKSLVIMVSGVSYTVPNSCGNHIPNWSYKKPNKNKLLSVSVHGYNDIRKCINLKASIAFISPVFKTSSHEEKKGIGVVKLGLLSRKFKIPVIGLGGINEKNISLLRSIPIHGCAGIDIFEKHSNT